MVEETRTVDGIDLHVETTGEGPPVLLIHGLGGASTSWTPVAEALSERYRVIVPDLPGFGRSEKPDRSYTPAFYVDLIASLLDDLGIDKTHVVGSSLGGQIVLEFALEHPDRVNRVVAEGPPGMTPEGWEGSPGLAEFLTIADAESEDEIGAILEAVHPDGVDPPEHSRTPAELLEYLQSPGAREAFEAAFAGSAEAGPLTQRVDKIQPAPLIVWGQQDTLFPLEDVRPQLDATSKPTVTVVAESGHRPHLYRPSAFSELVEAHLEDRMEETDIAETLT